MIHTDGTPTVAMRGGHPDDSLRAAERAALADCVRHVTVPLDVLRRYDAAQKRLRGQA